MIGGVTVKRATMMLKKLRKSIIALNDSFGILILEGYLKGFKNGIESAKNHYHYCFESGGEAMNEDELGIDCAIDAYLEANRLAGVRITDRKAISFAIFQFRKAKEVGGSHVVER